MSATLSTAIWLHLSNKFKFLYHKLIYIINLLLVSFCYTEEFQFPLHFAGDSRRPQNIYEP